LRVHLASTETRTLRKEFVAALIAGDANMAELIGLDAISEGLGVGDLYDEVIGPALAEVGHQWETGRMTIADEHLATGIAYDVMKLLGRTATKYPRRSRERVLLAAVGTENHVTGLRMIGDLAEGAGFDVRYLGAAVPVETLKPVVAKHTPEIVGLSVTMSGSAARLGDALEEVLASGHAPRGILVGGLGVPEALRSDGRVRYAAGAREALRIIESLAEPVP
jgi:MerR family transcriptional regulator, light-induced transcriptional regulator